MDFNTIINRIPKNLVKTCYIIFSIAYIFALLIILIIGNWESAHQLVHLQSIICERNRHVSFSKMKLEPWNEGIETYGNEKSLESMFIDQTFYSESRNFSSLLQALSENENEYSKKYLLSAKHGSGKTMALKKLLKDWCFNLNKENKSFRTFKYSIQHYIEGFVHDNVRLNLLPRILFKDIPIILFEDLPGILYDLIFNAFTKKERIPLLMLLFEFRDIIDKDTLVNTVFEKFIQDSTLFQKENLDMILWRAEREITLVFDDWDEYTKKTNEVGAVTEINSIVKCEEMKDINLIITARTEEVLVGGCYAFETLTLAPFYLPNDRDTFIYNYFTDDQDAQELIGILNEEDTIVPEEFQRHPGMLLYICNAWKYDQNIKDNQLKSNEIFWDAICNMMRLTYDRKYPQNMLTVDYLNNMRSDEGNYNLVFGKYIKVYFKEFIKEIRYSEHCSSSITSNNTIIPIVDNNKKDIIPNSDHPDLKSFEQTSEGDTNDGFNDENDKHMENLFANNTDTSSIANDNSDSIVDYDHSKIDFNIEITERDNKDDASRILNECKVAHDLINLQDIICERYFKENFSKIKMDQRNENIDNNESESSLESMYINQTFYSKSDKISNLLHVISKNKRYLLVAEPGSGKTTAIKKMLKDWCENLKKENKSMRVFNYAIQNYVENVHDSCNECIRKYYDSKIMEDSIHRMEMENIPVLIFAFEFRSIININTLTDTVFLQIIQNSTLITITNVELILKREVRRILLVLDGWDEYTKLKYSVGAAPEMEAIVKQEEMKNINLIVTTRPWRSDELLMVERYGFEKLSLEGFHLPKDRNTFINNFFPDEQNAQELINILDEKDTIIVNELQRIPRMLVYICNVWKNERQKKENQMRNKETFWNAIWEMMLLTYNRKYTQYPMSFDDLNAMRREIGIFNLENETDKNITFKEITEKFGTAFDLFYFGLYTMDLYRKSGPSNEEANNKIVQFVTPVYPSMINAQTEMERNSLRNEKKYWLFNL